MLLESEHHLFTVSSDFIDVLASTEHDFERYGAIVDSFKLKQV